MTMNCPHCQTEFTPTYKDQAYCQPKCRINAQKKRSRKNKDLVRQLPKNQPVTTEPGECKRCSAPLPVPRPPNQNFCTRACAKKHYGVISSRRQSIKGWVRLRKGLSKRFCETMERRGHSAEFSSYFNLSCMDTKLLMERRMQPWMKWEDYGSRWVVDHIIPVMVFDLSREDHRRLCYSPQNIRPLCKIENNDKGNQIIMEIIPPLLRARAEHLGVL